MKTSRVTFLQVVPGAVITIRNPDTGEVLGPNERGEICIKTERNFVGYINNEKVLASLLRNNQ